MPRLRSRVRDSSPAPDLERKLHRLPFFLPENWLEFVFGSLRGSRHVLAFTVTIRSHGGVAKWLCSGLQSRLRRFDPDPRLQSSRKSAACAFFVCASCCARCPSGEIGRHSGLKIRRLPERGRTGSIPVSGTKSSSCPRDLIRSLNDGNPRQSQHARIFVFMIAIPGVNLRSCRECLQCIRTFPGNFLMFGK